MLDHSCQVQRHKLADRLDDCYETPPVAIAALLRVERLPHRLWDPCCGPGNIVDVLRAPVTRSSARISSITGDPDFFARRDFLMERKAPDGCEGITMNPPFKLAGQFIEHALDLSPLVIALLRLAFMESDRRTRDPRRPWPRADPPISQAPPDDASAWMGGSQGEQRHGVRLVRLGSRAHRGDQHRSDLLGGGGMSAHQPQRTFVLQLTPKRGVDPIRALRALLKIALRKYQLRCTSIEEIKPPEQSQGA